MRGSFGPESLLSDRVLDENLKKNRGAEIQVDLLAVYKVKQGNMARKKILRGALITIGSIGALFIVLVVHIAMVSSPDIPNSNLVVSRIDFSETLDGEEVKTIRKSLKSIDGIHKVVLNEGSKTLIYGYYREQQAEAAVLENLSKVSTISFEAYKPSKAESEGSCPAIDKSSFTYRVGRAIQTIFS